MIAVTNDVGFARVSVDLVARRARTAKRTFYEFFDDKEACLIAAYDAVMTALLEIVNASTGGRRDASSLIDNGLRAALEAIDDHPAAARFALAECPGATRAMTEHRMLLMERFAASVCEWHAFARAEDASLGEISDVVAMSVVGAFLEPVSATLLRDPQARVAEMFDELRQVVRSLLLGPDPAA